MVCVIERWLYIHHCTWTTLANKDEDFWSHDDFIGNLELCILVYGEERELGASAPGHEFIPTHTHNHTLYMVSVSIDVIGIIVRLVSPWERSDVSSSVWCGSAWKEEIGEHHHQEKGEIDRNFWGGVYRILMGQWRHQMDRKIASMH